MESLIVGLLFSAIGALSYVAGDALMGGNKKASEKQTMIEWLEWKQTHGL
jgi:hypothetical protein